MRSPFKFLDPFTLTDKEVFFGRDKEIRQLYRQVLRTRLLLLYGLSGTGKTSLIQCGLAREFNGPDWLPLWIRHQTDINESLQVAIKRMLPEAEGEITDQIRQLYQHFLRPVYLIFDQFEELFILGNKEEQKTFVLTLRKLLDAELPCTVLIVIREEYLGRLYLFEKVIPNLFDFRLRVEPMDNTNVEAVLEKSFQKFNISVEGDTEAQKKERLNEIIQNVSQERSRIELPYLQVYLDQLYREDFERTYPGQTIVEGQSLPRIEFTKDEIEEFGTIDKVLDRFLDEQIQVIQEKLLALDSATSPNVVKRVLDAFVTDEGTKRPVRYTRTGGMIAIDPAQLDFFPKLAPSILTICLDELERTKLLRAESDTLEIAHDSLAQIIDSKRTDEQRGRNNMKRQIRLAADMFAQTGEYLTKKQLAKFDEVVAELDVREHDFFEDSKRVREDEEKAELEKERARIAELENALKATEAAKKEADGQARIAEENAVKASRSAQKARNWLFVAVTGLIMALAGIIYAFQKRQVAEEAQNEAITAQQVAETNLRQFQKSEFDDYLLDAATFATSGDTTQVRVALDSAKRVVLRFFSKTPEAGKLRAKIDRLENKLKKK
ncbi:hypothetical protein [Spirosoma sp. KNUC1025]|uniref:nSTAND1 domain-containing NTPase n=1 Tax=Spirosoma sp. KNUC1025 TaxID=2894082 RepID=UPI00386A028A|nr:hypothetical protein LN737_22345 [Spirosoma sp. KNUC1025]